MAAEGGGSKLGAQSDVVLRKKAEHRLSSCSDEGAYLPLIRHIADDGITDRGMAGADPEESETRLCGWLIKCGNIGFMKTSKQLWFVFSDETCKLYFYRNPQDLLPLGEIDIRHASFHFDANNQKPGLFEIRSDGKAYQLDAAGQHKKAYWLEALQKKRRLYGTQRKVISPEKMSWTLKNQRRGSGLTGFGEGPQLHLSREVKPPSPDSTSGSSFDELPSAQDCQELPPVNKPRILSISNFRSDIREIFSNMRSPTSPSGKLSPSSTTTLEGKEDWTIVEQDTEQTSLSPTTMATSPSSPSTTATTTTATTNPGTKLGGRFAKMFRTTKRSHAENYSSSVSSKDQGSRKSVYQPEQQTCFKCKVLQRDLVSVQEDLRAVEEEMEANREIIRLLQKELDVMRVSLDTRKESVGKTEDEKDMMIQLRDKHVVELEHSLAIVHEQKGMLEQQAKQNEGAQKELQDEVTMLQEMLMVKDELVAQLTGQIFDLENSNSQGREDDTEQPRPVLQLPSSRELQMLKDSVQAYQLQNNFLTKEIMELNELRKVDDKREKELLMKYVETDAKYCQAMSKYYFLLNENKDPVRGGEEIKSQEAVAQLLQEALDTETEGSAAEDREDTRHYFLSSHSNVQQYDGYGFLMCANEEETDDILIAKAAQLQRQSDEINNRIKDVDEVTSKLVKWQNFMVGQARKPLVRSPELKALIRMGIPHEHKEHIWKGCINLYTAQTRDKMGPMYYKKDLGERIKNSKSNPAVKQIELDLLRTLPNNRHFDSIDSDGIPKLRRVLLSYSVHNPIIGYCQGLNRLAAIALLFLSEEEAFWCLEAIVEHLMPKEYYTKTLAAAQADQRVLKELVSEKLPKLHTHLEQHDVDLSLYTFNWFLTIFVDNVRPETFLRCWDAFLYEGSKVLFRFAVAFLKYAEEEILTLKEAPLIYRYMRMLGERVADIKKISHIAFNDLNPFPMRSVNNKRVFHMQMVQEELRELDIIRQDFQSSQSPGFCKEDFMSDDDLDLDETQEEEEEEDVNS